MVKWMMIQSEKRMESKPFDGLKIMKNDMHIFLMQMKNYKK